MTHNYDINDKTHRTEVTPLLRPTTKVRRDREAISRSFLLWRQWPQERDDLVPLEPSIKAIVIVGGWS